MGDPHGSHVEPAYEPLFMTLQNVILLTHSNFSAGPTMLSCKSKFLQKVTYLKFLYVEAA